MVHAQDTWSEYLLADGTILRNKAVLTKVWRLCQIFCPNGMPFYVYSTQNVPSVIPEMTYTKRPSVAEIAALHGFAPVPEDIQKQNLDVETL